eukprot:s1804_g6.t1
MQVYLQLDYDSIKALPDEIFNRKPGITSAWRHVRCSVVPPAVSMGPCIAFKRSSIGMESVLRSAVLNGVPLLKKQIELCMEAEGVAYPETGSGAGGRVLVQDLATALVEHVLSDCSKDIQEVAIRKMARVRKDKDEDDDPTDFWGADEDCPIEMLRILASLDLDNKQQFQKVSEYAAAALEKKVRKQTERATSQKVREAAAAAREQVQQELAEASAAGPASTKTRPAGVVIPAHKKVRAPESLLALLPPGIHKCYFNVRTKSRVASVEFLRDLACGADPDDPEASGARWARPRPRRNGLPLPPKATGSGAPRRALFSMPPHQQQYASQVFQSHPSAVHAMPVVEAAPPPPPSGSPVRGWGVG